MTFVFEPPDHSRVSRPARYSFKWRHVPQGAWRLFSCANSILASPEGILKTGKPTRYSLNPMRPNIPNQLAQLMILTAALFGTTTAAAADKPIKVFLLAGQSNMQGQANVQMDHPVHYNGGKGNLVWAMEHSQSKDQMKHLRDNKGNWTQRNDVAVWYKVKGKVRQGPLTIGYTGYDGKAHFGPELQFGHVVADAYKQRVLLIKTAWGGKSLYKDFRPPSADGETGPYYTQMIAEVREALAALKGKRYELAGFIWQQGWNDMVNKDATAEYADNLVHLAKDIRAEFKTPELPFVVGELGNTGPAEEGSGMHTFRKAQRQGTAKINHAAFVETAAFARDKDLSPNVTHGHHWFGNAESYFLIGDALGKAAVKMSQRDE